ncbi:hypothetical protein HPB50_005803 [Hyalomma asiaticum]|uniref:Uncharacterized protein n=1 Tax=Hyalomma asiaticum TaxID=266040 RepID=A0ACB7RPY0_HYAAI|nr:hypothetical protein HPB50_005803 [Hyalomma asiaticum]
MGRRCFVPNCNSGYKSCAEKVRTFKAPAGPERLQEWARAIGWVDRDLTTCDYVCEKHFPSEMVSRRKYYAELGGAVILDQPKTSSGLQSTMFWIT